MALHVDLRGANVTAHHVKLSARSNVAFLEGLTEGDGRPLELPIRQVAHLDPRDLGLRQARGP